MGGAQSTAAMNIVIIIIIIIFPNTQGHKNTQQTQVHTHTHTTKEFTGFLGCTALTLPGSGWCSN